VSEFKWPIRVYYEDTDSGGVVYYANYLKFMERARTEFLRKLGFEQDILNREQGIIFAVRSVSVDYLKPARFNDLLEVSAKLVEVGKASLLFEQTIKKTVNQPVVLCTAQIKIVCLDAQTFRPKPIPANVVAEIPGES
jgi:acyl-CoA thioester hydrolase